MISFAIWLQNTPLYAAARDSSYAYPIILTLHVTFISLFGAMILATDLRLLGWGFRKHTVSDIVNQLRWPKRIGFLLVATCGVLVLGMKAEEYFLNPFFRLKVTLLTLVAIHALVFRGSVYSKAAEFDALPELPGRETGRCTVAIFVGEHRLRRPLHWIFPSAARLPSFHVDAIASASPATDLRGPVGRLSGFSRALLLGRALRNVPWAPLAGTMVASLAAPTACECLLLQILPLLGSQHQADL